jgi:hypothetical protein
MITVSAEPGWLSCASTDRSAPRAASPFGFHHTERLLTKIRDHANDSPALARLKGSPNTETGRRYWRPERSTGKSARMAVMPPGGC